MAKVIIVRGLSGTGKTTSITNAMNLLGIHVGNGPRDVLVVAKLHLQTRSYSVGIASGGDTRQVLQANIAFFQRHTPDIMIFASRTGGAGRVFLDAFVSSLAVQPIIIATRKAAPPTPASISANITQTTQAIIGQVP